MKQTIEDLRAILNKEPKWHLAKHLRDYINKLESGSGRRTPSQNASIHLGFQFIADTLNERGKDMKAVLKPSVDIWWTKDTVKHYLYKPILKLFANKESTTEMDKSEPGQAWDIMMKFLGEKHQVEYIPFPSKSEEKQETDRLNLKEIIKDYPDEEPGDIPF